MSDRNACDVELLMVRNTSFSRHWLDFHIPRALTDVSLAPFTVQVGGFSPLTGFMNEAEYDHVVEDMCLPHSKLLFGLPVVMDTDSEDIKVTPLHPPGSAAAFEGGC